MSAWMWSARDWGVARVQTFTARSVRSCVRLGRDPDRDESVCKNPSTNVQVRG